MFKACFLKLKHIYDLIAKTYANFLLNSTWRLIFTYILVSVLLSFGLLQIKIDMETESLSYVKNSEALQNFKLLSRTFEYNQYARQFANKQLYVGYYVEIIVCAKPEGKDSKERKSNEDLLKPEFNLLNRTYLDEFNRLYDNILEIELENDEENLGTK